MRADSPSKKMVMGGTMRPAAAISPITSTVCRIYLSNYSNIEVLRHIARHSPRMRIAQKLDNRAEGVVNGSYSVALKLYSGFMTSMNALIANYLDKNRA